jgi:hypothetical protein
MTERAATATTRAAATTTTTTELTGGDWVMAVVSFFLTPIISILLSIYNFARGRRSQGLLYLGVLGVQILLGLVLFMGR